jgi:hypothetical protein
MEISSNSAEPSKESQVTAPDDSPFRLLSSSMPAVLSSIASLPSDDEPELPNSVTMFRDLKEADYKNTYKNRMVLPKPLSNSPVRARGALKIRSKDFLDDSRLLIKSCVKTPRLPAILRRCLPTAKPQPELSQHSSGRKSLFTKTKLASLKSVAEAGHFQNKGEQARARAIREVGDRVIGQLGSVKGYCSRYALTAEEFTTQLEEFAILSLESAKSGVGVHPQVLSDYYCTNVYALRGINPRLLDPSTVDRLDLDRVITPSMLLSWQEFTLYYSLVITQRTGESDVLKFLFTLARITHASHLRKKSLLHTLKSRFLFPHKITAQQQQIWAALTETISKKLDLDSSTLDEFLNSGQPTGVSISALRELAKEAFRSHEAPC